MFELVVRYVYERWTDWLAERDTAGDHLLFTAAPASIAVGLGYVFARAPMRFVHHG